jgi:hypothetical protein
LRFVEKRFLLVEVNINYRHDIVFANVWYVRFTGDEGKMSDSLKWFAFMSYGVGHVLNDLVASMWFTYALVFYHYVMQLSRVVVVTARIRVQ